MLKIQTTEKPAQEAAAYINSLLVTHAEQAILLMLAGGSAKAVLPFLDAELLGEHVTVTVTDERYTEDLMDNNFAALQGESFYNGLIDVGAYCIDTQIYSGENPVEHAERFDKNIKSWKADFPKGKIIALFGVGTDGHIAGVLPKVLNDSDFDRVLNNEANIVASIDATGQNDHPLRTTVTLPFIKHVDHAIVYMVGQEKAVALADIITKEGDIHATPARVLNDVEDAIIFTDISVEPA